MATRFYLPSTGAADNSPAASTWTETTGVDYRRAVLTRIASAMTSKVQAHTATAANSTFLSRVYVSDPLAAQSLSASTIKGTIRVLESAANDNLDAMRLVVRIVSNDGTTFRSPNVYGPTNSTVAEFNTSLRAKRLATGGATNAVTISAGDRLVIEIGTTATTGGTSLSDSISYGDNSATDLGDNETDTAANNPFVELAATLQFLNTGTSAVTGTAATSAASGKLEFIGTVADTATVATTAATGGLVFTGTSAVTATAATTTATGTQTDPSFTGTSSVTATAATTAGTGSETFTGTSAASATAATTSTSGLLVFTGTSSVTCTAASSQATATLSFVGTSAGTATPATTTVSGALTFAGSSSLTAVGATTNATASLDFAGTGSPNAAAASTSGTAALEFSGSIAAPAAPSVTSSSGTLNFIGTSDLIATPATSSASEGVSNAITGTAALSATPATSNADGAVQSAEPVVTPLPVVIPWRLRRRPPARARIVAISGEGVGAASPATTRSTGRAVVIIRGTSRVTAGAASSRTTATQNFAGPSPLLASPAFGDGRGYATRGSQEAAMFKFLAEHQYL